MGNRAWAVVPPADAVCLSFFVPCSGDFPSGEARKAKWPSRLMARPVRRPGWREPADAAVRTGEAEPIADGH